jgi:hypothetical protein
MVVLVAIREIDYATHPVATGYLTAKEHLSSINWRKMLSLPITS